MDKIVSVGAAAFALALTLAEKPQAADLLRQPSCTDCQHIEFRVDGAPGLVFAITDWTEDNEAQFLRIDAQGNQQTLMDVIPVVRDADGSTYLSYSARDIASIVSRRGRSGLEYLVAFDDEFYDTEGCHPGWQHRMPMVLFTEGRGADSTPLSSFGLTPILAHFTPMSLPTLEAKIRRPARHAAGRLNCDGGCCTFDRIDTSAPAPATEPQQVEPGGQKAPTWYRGEIMPSPAK